MLEYLQSITDQLTTAIGHQETNGGVAGVGASLNNPGALKFAPWETSYGASQGANGFAKFPDLTSGFAAARDRVSQLIKGGASVSDLINTWAPASDKNTNNQQRISDIAKQTGLDPSKPIASQAGEDSGSLAGDIFDSTVGKLFDASIGRTVAFIMGAVLVIIGLLFLKQTQVIVQPLVEGVRTGAKSALKKGLIP